MPEHLPHMNAAPVPMNKPTTAIDLSATYQTRFGKTGLSKRDRVWKRLCSSFFQKHVPESATVLDLACGYGEFINNIRARKKIAVDLNPDSPRHLAPEVQFHLNPATDLSFIPSGTIDRVFTSNFLEHLRDKQECDALFSEILRVLKPGGRFLILGPNIRYAYKEYWDFYDHYLALSHLSLSEGLRIAGFGIERCVPRFLPYTMAGKQPTHDLLIRLYLAMPLAWRIIGKQFFVVARKPG